MRLLRDLQALYRHRELLWIWTLREIKVRYKQSVLGIAWAVLQPLALMLVFTTVFSVLVKIPTDDVPYPVFSYTALLAWTFFATAVSFAIPTLVNNLNLVTKVYFPREILPIASVGAAFVDFLVAGGLLVVVLVYYQIPFEVTLLWVPLLVGVQVLLTLGVVLPASALNVFYRDIRFVVPLAIQLWLYATPVIYPVSLVPAPVRPLYILNPMVGLIDSYRRVIVQGLPPVPEYLAISTVVSLVLAVAGYTYFKRSEASFADLI
jgi:lipopolysaccharide transport system permease protein